MAYILFILISMLIIFIFNVLFPYPAANFDVTYALIATIVNTVAVIAFDGIIAFLIRRMPEKWFSYKKSFFNVGRKEKKFYQNIKVKKWKDLVLELGCFTHFSKKHFTDRSNPLYTHRFILESCYGIVIHIACVLVGFFIIFLYPISYAPRFGIPVALVNAFLNILPIFVLRSNLPFLVRLHEHNIRKDLTVSSSTKEAH